MKIPKCLIIYHDIHDLSDYISFSEIIFKYREILTEGQNMNGIISMFTQISQVVTMKNSQILCNYNYLRYSHYYPLIFIVYIR